MDLYTNTLVAVGRAMARDHFDHNLTKWDGIILAESKVAPLHLDDQRVILSEYINSFRALTVAARFESRH